MRTALHFATGNDELETPQEFFDQCSMAAGGFVADMAANLSNTKVPENWWGPDHVDPARRDCLTVEWPTDGPVWINPIYSNPEAPCHPTNCKKKRCREREEHISVYAPGCIDFVEKAFSEMINHGVETWMLLAARTSNRWFHQFIWDADRRSPRRGVSLQFIEGRLKFGGIGNSAPFPSILVRFKRPEWPFGG